MRLPLPLPLPSPSSSLSFPSLSQGLAWLPAAMLSLVLAGCGGGSPGSTADATATPTAVDPAASTPTGTPTGYWVAGLARSASKSVFVVFDPAKPTEALYTRDITGVSLPQPWPLSGVDAAGSSAMVTPYSAVSFLVNGRVEYMSLARADSLTPRTLSQATDVCAMWGGGRATANGKTIELFMVQRGPHCQALSGYTYANFSSSLTATSAAPVGWADTMPTPLPDLDSARFLMLRMQAQSGGSYALQAFDDQGVALSPVTGATGLSSSAWTNLGPEGDKQSALVALGQGQGSTLRRLSWTGSSAVLGSSVIHRVGNSLGGWATSGQGTFFIDGQALYRVAPGATTTELMLTGSESGFVIVPMYQHVAALFQAPLGCPHANRKCIRLEAVVGPGGTVRSYMLEGTATAAPSVARISGNADRLVVITPQDNGSQTLGVLDLDGADAAPTVVQTGGRLLGWITPYGVVPGSYSWTASAALWCSPTANGSCAGQPLVQQNLGNLSATTLGTLPAGFTGTPAWVAYDKLSTAIGVPLSSQGDEDLYVLTPGVASSLTLVRAHP
jgi:hypothetical protein